MEQPGNFPYANMFQIWMIWRGLGLFLTNRQQQQQQQQTRTNRVSYLLPETQI